jgi:glycosyltransferase involved in cell wall biosynthesis
MNLSVVVATLGGPSLVHTIRCLKESTWKPSEILICIPQEEVSLVSPLQVYPSVRIVPTNVRGQVAQRIVGFTEAKENIVLQCDDDIEFGPKVLEILGEVLVRLGDKNVIGPTFCDISSRRPLAHYVSGYRGFLADVYFFFVANLPWGKGRMGRFSSTTCAVSVDPRYASVPIVETEWLAGGFVMGWRKDLILTNFYPFSGKAYCEDLVHSVERKRLGVKHSVVISEHVYIAQDNVKLSFLELMHEIRARYRIGRRMGGGIMSTGIFLIIDGLRRLVSVRK